MDSKISISGGSTTGGTGGSTTGGSTTGGTGGSTTGGSGGSTTGGTGGSTTGGSGGSTTGGSGGSTTGGSGGSTTGGSAAIPENFDILNSYEIPSSSNGGNISSSYIVYALPHDAGLVDGWKITIKAENGPIFVYPSHDVNINAIAPVIDDNKNFVVLTTPGSIVEFNYSSGVFTTSVLAGNLSYDLFKNDAPDVCPTGMFAVPGSNLLETNGFCVTQGYYSASSAVPNTLFQSEGSCQNIAANYGSGTSSILSFNQYQTILHKSLSHRSGGDFILNATEKTNFINQFPKYTTVSRSSNVCESHINCYQYQTDGKVYTDATNYIKLRTSCSRKQVYSGGYPSRCSYYEIESLELFKTGDGTNVLTPSTCTNTIGPDQSNLNIISNASGIGKITGNADFHINEKNPTCDFTALNLFYPVNNNSTAFTYFPSLTTTLTPTQVNTFAIIHKTQIAKQFAFVNSATSQGLVYYHCAFNP